jgi:3-oxo-5-alpha-steroid 4-dehydrogenase 3 / polyprenol reductase
MVLFSWTRANLDVSLSESLRNAINVNSFSAIALFLTSSLWQFHIHSILASLRPTSVKPVYKAPPPSSLPFRLFLTPHYTAEILLYLALALLCQNWTLFMSLIWTITNLAVSSGETREWARKKFEGKEWGRWNLIPFIY